MSDIIQNEDLIFHDSDGKEKAILGTLEGECATSITATRNGRFYGDSLWRKVFSSPIVNEMIENGGIPGEFDHPSDGREETDSARIAILMKEKPKEKNGKLWAKFDILNTPLGKIAYTLAKAGFKLGVSSRGSGDTFINNKGEEEVDESTYDFKCFDLVLLPAVKEARLKLVTEGLQKKFDYKKALNESLNSASKKDRTLMEETLNNLGIDYKNSIIEDTKINVPVSASPEGAKLQDEEEIEDAEENNASSKEADNIDVDNDDIAADNDGADDLKNLQEALRQNRQLEKKIIDLQEKLSVCYAKEAKYEASLSKYRTSIRALSESLKSKSVLDEKVSVLENQLDEKVKTIKEKESIIEKLEKDKQVLSYRKREEAYTLNEGLNKKDEQIASLTKKVSSLKESLSNAKEESQKEIDKLNEELSEAKKDSLIASKNYSNKLSKQNELVEQYKQIANRAVNKYIDSQALRLGLTSEEIKNRLPKGYSFNDIDTICENLQTYRVGISKLPFNVETLNEDFSGMKIKATESKEPMLGINAEDDTVDNSLMSMVNTILNK